MSKEVNVSIELLKALIGKCNDTAVQEILCEAMVKLAKHATK